VADALRTGGALAIISTHHVAGGDQEFFVELDRSGRFGPVAFRRYEWELAYSTAAYLEVLSTYSGHLALTPKARGGLFDCIADLIDSHYGGRISKRYLTELQVAHAR
jgi:hypothetical protein